MKTALSALPLHEYIGRDGQRHYSYFDGFAYCLGDAVPGSATLRFVDLMARLDDPGYRFAFADGQCPACGARRLWRHEGGNEVVCSDCEHADPVLEEARHMLSRFEGWRT
jgi:Zn ribbon nucleic-acid-binding protein